MNEIFADLHVHIGRSESGKPIKITGARSLQFANIARECADRKGINMVGIIDCASPYVIEDIENFLKTGEAYEIEDGGIIFKEKFDRVFAIELGLSADTFLADEISELETRTFVTNSDAHSLPKIAREYNKILVDGISFKELLKALKNEDGRKILANYGLDPKLGKYHRTYCEVCEKNIEGKPPVTHCDTCDSRNITMGVLDRIEMIKDKPETKSPENRPPYIYQIPLTFEKLLDHFETEMNILHKLSKDDIEAVVGEKVANSIVNAREGNVHIHAGGGGVYGKIENK